MMCLVFMGIEGAQWLGQCIEENIIREEEKTFIRTFQENDTVYVIRRFTNSYRWYLELTEYGRNGCKGRLVIPEGRKQSGWRGFRGNCTFCLTHRGGEDDAEKKSQTLRDLPRQIENHRQFGSQRQNSNEDGGGVRRFPTCIDET